METVKNRKPSIVVSCHAVFSPAGEPMHGTGSEIGNFLQKRKKQYLFIRHSLYGDFPTQIESFDGKNLTYKFFGIKGLSFFLRILQEQIITFYLVLKIGTKPGLLIGIDPLNALNGLILKRLGLVQKVVFYTADYTSRRFNNSLLNSLYHKIDKLAIKNADQVWNVSSRINNLRIKQGVSKERNVFVPNSPIFEKVKRLPYSQINKHQLVIVSHLTKAINWSLIFRVVKKLSNRFKDIKLVIIGSGPYEQQLKNLVKELKIEKRIIFLGQKTHEDCLEILAQSAIGLAVYTQAQSWTIFGDSLKIREYFACGLPVITTSVPSTADDVEKEQAGIIVRLSEENLKEAIDRLFSQKQLYLKMRRNGINLAREYDFARILKENLVKLKNF